MRPPSRVSPPAAPVCAAQWHGEVDALTDALAGTVLAQERALEGLDAWQVLLALANVAGVVVLGQPAAQRKALREALETVLREHVIEEGVHEGAAVGRTGVN